MRILIVCQYYHPEQFQINEIAPELVRRGHEVTVLTGTPNYPKGEVFPGYEKGKRADEVIDGVRVVRSKVIPRGKGPVGLIRNYVSFAASASRRAGDIEGPFDVVLCYQLSPITMVKPAIECAKRWNIPLVLYCLDIWPESALAHVGSKSNSAYKAIARLSSGYYRACAKIAVTSRPFIDYLSSENGVSLDRLSYIPQHAADSYLERDFSGSDNGVVDFMFAGNLGAGATLEVIVYAVAVLKDVDGFLVHMVGDGSERQKLEALAEEYGVSDKLIFHGNQSRDEMPKFYEGADALLITLRGNNAVGNTMPGKLQTYMAVGKPIFGAINGAANEVIHEANCGDCVAAGDFEGLARLMLDYMENPSVYAECGANARDYFRKNFTLDLYCERIERLMLEAVGDR